MKNDDNPWRMAGMVGTLGVEIFSFIIGGAFLGRYLDEHFGFTHLWLAIGAIGGFFFRLSKQLLYIEIFYKGLSQSGKRIGVVLSHHFARLCDLCRFFCINLVDDALEGTCRRLSSRRIDQFI
ncbi:AtpZ/AtpI family protein [Terrilactibacillus sp. S3-3]|nr:AtpZ/AtpI family protein [Terrilactibacillus sp. S3-3]